MGVADNLSAELDGPVRPMAPGDPGQRRTLSYAALDLGTNNCRLLIAEPNGKGGFRVVDSFSRIVRLGEGLAERGALKPEAMERAIDALKVCAQKMRRWRVTHRHMVATAACRAAVNQAEFVTRVQAETGITLDVISPDEEIRLTVASCHALVDRACESTLIFDIGGGSTELAWVVQGDRGRPSIAHWVSVPLGVVTLAEAFGGHEVSAESYAAMVAEGMRRIEAAGLPQGPFTPARGHLMGTSGTVTILAGLHLGLERYDRDRIDGLWLDPHEIEGVALQLRRMSYDARCAHGCIGPARADLVVPGAAIFEAIWRLWPSPRLRVADRGLREGMLMGMMAKSAKRRRNRKTLRRRGTKRVRRSLAGKKAGA